MTQKSDIKAEHILSLISEITGIEIEDLAGPIRLKEVMEAEERTEFCAELESRYAILVEEPDLTRLKTIGKLLTFIAAQAPEEEEEEEKPYRKFNPRKPEED